MKKLIILLYVFVLVVFVELLVTYSINEIYISKYEKEEYDKGLVKSLFVLNYNERYIPYYNYGNYLYKMGDYKNAIIEYEKSLKKGVPDKRVCFVRINLSLAMTNTISDNMELEKKLEIYEKAREVLYEDDCAVEGSSKDGESQEAEQLEEDIRNKEEELKKDNSDPNKGSSGEKEDEENKQNEKKQEEEKSNELEKRNKGSNKSRQEGLDEYKGWDDSAYYSGKKW